MYGGLGELGGTSLLDQLKQEALTWIQNNVHVTLSPQAQQAIQDQYVKQRLAQLQGSAWGAASKYMPWIIGGGILLLLARSRR